MQLDFSFNLLEGVLAARLHVNAYQQPLVYIEARPDLGYHLSVDL